MDKSRTAWSPWRSWTAIALVLVTLALVQACGDSGKSTGPTSNAALQLKLRRVNGAELPAGCNGKYSVSGPGVNISNAALSESAKISFQGQIGQTYVVSVELTCGLALVAKQGFGETLTGSTEVKLGPGSNEATITLIVSKVLGLKCNSPVAPNAVSHCTCDVQSPGVPNIGWQGATPKGGNKADFSSPTEGSFPVTCSVNGVAVATTNVVVEANTITVRVENLPLGQLRKSASQNRIRLAQGCCPFFVRFVGVVGPTEVLRDESKTFGVPPNTVFQASCNSGFDGVFHQETVTQSKTIALDGSECG